MRYAKMRLLEAPKGVGMNGVYCICSASGAARHQRPLNSLDSTTVTKKMNPIEPTNRGNSNGNSVSKDSIPDGGRKIRANADKYPTRET